MEFTMTCPYCHQIIPEDLEICPECGRSMEMVCRGCHRVVGKFFFDEYKLCQECGLGPMINSLAGSADQEDSEEEEEEDFDPNDLDDQDDQDEVEPHEVLVGGDVCGFKIYE